MPRKITTQQFIERSQNVIRHPNHAYDYSKCDYKSIYSPVIIICPIHGEFEQKPSDHLNGCGCKECGKKHQNENRIRTCFSKDPNYLKNNFLKKAKRVHGDRYDYSLVDYKGQYELIDIICPVHGPFKQKPSNHINGCGCQRCWEEKKQKLNDEKNELTASLFVSRAKEIHGDRYDYTKTKFISWSNKVIVTCKEHGDWLICPQSHISGCGCKKCGNIEVGNKRRKSNEGFIEGARKVHGNKYDYTKVVYKSNMKKVIITCSSHGDFLQEPVSHLKGCGCPCCAQEKGIFILKV